MRILLALGVLMVIAATVAFKVAAALSGGRSDDWGSVMTPTVSLIVSAGLTWLMLLVASLARSRGWTPSGLKIAFGNRDDVPEPSPFAARADRAARNMVENLALLAALLTAAGFSDVPDAELTGPCALFVYARLVYAPLYWAGVKYLRTVAWTVSIIGLFRIAQTML